MADTRLSPLAPAAPGNPISDVKKGGLNAKDKLFADLVAKLEEARNAQAEAEALRKQADELERDGNNPEEVEKLRAHAGELEEKAKKLIRMARRMQRGVFQGVLAGAGIGAGVAGGLGTLVGSLVGGVTAIPTTVLGALIGAGTGAIHGPWVKLVEDTAKEADEAEALGEELDIEDID